MMQLLVAVLLCGGVITIASDWEEKVVSRFQQYLKINTAHPNPLYYDAVEFLEEAAESLPLEPTIVEFAEGKPLLLLKWAGSSPELPSILLLSHTDVVPAEAHFWKHPPFSGHLDPSTGDIFGRGSQDMKCVSLQYIEALHLLHSSAFVPLRTIYILFIPDEEIGGHDGAGYFVQSPLFRTMNIGIVLNEGSASPNAQYGVVYAEKAVWHLIIKGAIGDLLESLETIARFRGSQFDLVKSGEKVAGEIVSVNAVFLKANESLASEAEAGFDIRLPPSAKMGWLERRIAEEWAPSSRNMTFMFEFKESNVDESGEPMLTRMDESNPWWSLLQDAVKEAGGQLGAPQISRAASDSRFFRFHGIPAIGFSPIANTPILLHQHNEFLNKHVYITGIHVYRSVIEAFASYGGRR